MKYLDLEMDESWKKIRSELKSKLGQDIYKNWIEVLSLVKVKSNVAHFHVPSSFIANWIDRNYRDQIIEDHINRPVAISCGFLDTHQIGSSLSGGGRRKVRVSRTSNNVIRAPEQVSSVLMLPITSVLLIRGDPERDILNDEHLHIHVTSVEHASGNYNAQERYHLVERAIGRLLVLLSHELPDGLRDSIEDMPAL